MDALGNNVVGKITGDVAAVFCDKYGNENECALIERMVYSPDSEYNLFILTKRLIAGYILGGDWHSIWIIKGNKKIVFDIKVLTPKGAIFAVYFKRKLLGNGEMAAVGAERNKLINANAVHALVGHMNDESGKKL